MVVVVTAYIVHASCTMQEGTMLMLVFYWNVGGPPACHQFVFSVHGLWLHQTIPQLSVPPNRQRIHEVTFLTCFVLCRPSCMSSHLQPVTTAQRLFNTVFNVQARGLLSLQSRHHSSSVFNHLLYLQALASSLSVSVDLWCSPKVSINDRGLTLGPSRHPNKNSLYKNPLSMHALTLRWPQCETRKHIIFSNTVINHQIAMLAWWRM